MLPMKVIHSCIKPKVWYFYSMTMITPDVMKTTSSSEIMKGYQSYQSVSLAQVNFRILLMIGIASLFSHLEPNFPQFGL